MRGWEPIISDVLNVIGMGTIRRKFILFSLLATLLPSLTMGWLSYQHYKQILFEKAYEELRNAAEHVALGLPVWLREQQMNAKVFATSPEVYENLEKSFRPEMRAKATRRLKDYLKLVRQRVDYDELAVLDLTGRVMAGTAEQVGPLHLPNDWMTRAKNDEPFFGTPYWNDAKRTTQMRLGVAVRRPTDHGLLGVLTAVVNFRKTEKDMTDSPLHEIGHLYLTTHEGTVIVGTRPAEDGMPTFRLDPATTKDLFEHDGASREYTDYRGKPVIGVLKPVQGQRDRDWGVVAEVPRTLVYAQVTRSLNQTILITLSLLLGIGLLAYALGLTIVRPLERLARGAARVAGGDLAVDVPVVSHGEVRYLTEVFNDMVARLRTSREELERLSVTDHLTGLHNRKYMMEALDTEIGREHRHKRPFSVLMLDLDHFKRYNDTHGHLAGDRLLVRVAKIFKESVRSVDAVGRYGGEEFLVLLPESAQADAWAVAERIRTRVAEETADAATAAEAVTISIGLAAFPGDGQTPEQLIATADAALYQAKRQGRNRVVVAGSGLRSGTRR